MVQATNDEGNGRGREYQKLIAGEWIVISKEQFQREVSSEICQQLALQGEIKVGADWYRITWETGHGPHVIYDFYERTIPHEHVTGVCRIGEGEKCCRYLAMDPRGYFCAKHSVSVRTLIEKHMKLGLIGAKGDNCDGYPPVVFTKENDKLRGLLAWGSDPCIYCNLPRAEMQRCQSGFPGCARGDDMMATPDLEDWIGKKTPPSES